MRRLDPQNHGYFPLAFHTLPGPHYTNLPPESLSTVGRAYSSEVMLRQILAMATYVSRRRGRCALRQTPLPSLISVLIEPGPTGAIRSALPKDTPNSPNSPNSPPGCWSCKYTWYVPESRMGWYRGRYVGAGRTLEATAVRGDATKLRPPVHRFRGNLRFRPPGSYGVTWGVSGKGAGTRPRGLAPLFTVRQLATPGQSASSSLTSAVLALQSSPLHVGRSRFEGRSQSVLYMIRARSGSGSNLGNS